MKKFILCLSILLVTPLALAQPSLQDDAQQAEALVSSVSETLESLQANDAIVFNSDADELQYTKAMMNAQKALRLISKVKEGLSSTNKIDLVMADARAIQTILGSYLGKETMFGYKLKNGPISVNIEGEGVFERIVRKLPFLGRVGGTITINPGEEIVTQFNSLKTEFYGLLVEASHLDKKDRRWQALAEWGNNTKVIYPGESFGKEIITWEQKIELER
ncbi:MAG: hypothetical protein A3B70_05645 [Deltaproteobacteria bacterium RIFCSPHIGHO2_02_FULL_40_11]|nr:MAG: hypothetical protein A3B70_05645 [Deltaproteobacteria bacterium RIFCSPHIGHO2_02_FULL_40_11]